ncbi:MAG TPA: hypothetical protein VHB02_06095 [Acidimicrobiales bacterium]|nr:hypothetical protein [Acidimicrobiales bacterium]
MSATAIPVTTIAKGGSHAAATAALAATMTIAVGHEPVLLYVHNADATHALTIEAAPGSGPSAVPAGFTWTVAANTDEWIVLPASGDVCDANGIVNLTVTVASGGALTGSKAGAIAAVSG